ncbi:MAG TPA: thiamine pyrophosphate-binding protein [Ottowia sp.]|uniref:thiamine pyrophosphate-binding protein n=1 Tax=Ottowia sp. TaxID=1898956 RepID=UPI002C1A8494|nr:thiamine pyrophosphate-binding protein [Ottowia sp.]HMN21444.1 thiamine pyrophosphate-binding protein [Ottowia sp.]
MKINEAVARTLKDVGVETLFGLIGDANLFLVDDFIRKCGGRYVGAAHEAGAVLMALGHASVSGGIGVATVTCGPGFTNTLTALVEGAKSRLPMVLVTGDATSKPKFYLQKVPQREFAIAAGAGFEQASSLDSVCADLVYAFRRADAERRPIVFNLPPYDLQWQDVGDYRPARLVLHRRASEVTDSADLEAAIGIVATAKRPIVLAGHGVAMSGAQGDVLRLARRIDAPVMTTLRAKDLFRGDPLNLDVFGISTLEPAMQVVAASDCIVAFGASLNFITTGNGALLQGKRTVLVNDDPDELGKHMSTDAAVLGDCGSAARRMLHWLDEAEIAASGFAAEDAVQAALATLAAPPPAAPARDPGAVEIHGALRAIAATLGEPLVLVTGVGRHMGHAWHAFHVSEPRLFVQGHMYGAIGMALAHGIGAARAEPTLPTVVVTGDGSFMLGDLTEFNTAVRERLDLVLVVCNDGGYGAEHIQFTGRDLDPSLSLIGWPDFAPMAEALGGQGLTVRSPDDLEHACQAIAARSRDRPILVDVKLDPDTVPRSY